MAAGHLMRVLCFAMVAALAASLARAASEKARLCPCYAPKCAGGHGHRMVPVGVACDADCSGGTPAWALSTALHGDDCDCIGTDPSDDVSLSVDYPPRPCLDMDSSLDAVDKWISYYKIAHSAGDPIAQAAAHASLVRSAMADKHTKEEASMREQNRVARQSAQLGLQQVLTKVLAANKAKSDQQIALAKQQDQLDRMRRLKDKIEIGAKLMQQAFERQQHSGGPADSSKMGSEVPVQERARKLIDAAEETHGGDENNRKALAYLRTKVDQDGNVHQGVANSADATTGGKVPGIPTRREWTELKAVAGIPDAIDSKVSAGQSLDDFYSALDAGTSQRDALGELKQKFVDQYMKTAVQKLSGPESKDALAAVLSVGEAIETAIDAQGPTSSGNSSADEVPTKAEWTKMKAEVGIPDGLDPTLSAGASLQEYHTSIANGESRAAALETLDHKISAYFTTLRLKLRGPEHKAKRDKVSAILKSIKLARGLHTAAQDGGDDENKDDVVPDGDGDTKQDGETAGSNLGETHHKKSHWLQNMKNKKKSASAQRLSRAIHNGRRA